jgi:hypothetical protein
MLFGGRLGWGGRRYMSARATAARARSSQPVFRPYRKRCVAKMGKCEGVE